MKEFFSSKKFKVILCICALFAGIMIYAAVSSSSNIVSSAIGAVLSPVQKISNSISSWVTSRIDMLVNAGDYYRENAELRDEIARLTAQMADYIQVKQENEHLREMVELAEASEGIEFSEPCTVIGRTANDVFGSFFIDKGSKDGVEINDPVVTRDGLAGFVSEVEYTYSKVTAIISNDISIGVYCVRTGETGVTEGSYMLASDKLMRMIYIPLDCAMQDGDIIITSGYSGIVPKGLVVGTVSEIKISENGLSKHALVSPVIDSEKLKTVYVIVDFDGKGSGFENAQ